MKRKHWGIALILLGLLVAFGGVLVFIHSSRLELIVASYSLSSILIIKGAILLAKSKRVFIGRIS